MSQQSTNEHPKTKKPRRLGNNMSKEVPLSVIIYDIKKRGLTPVQACDKHGLDFELLAPVYRDYFVVIFQKKV